MSVKKISQQAAANPAILVIEAAKFERRSLCRLMRAAGAERVAEAVDFDAARHQLAVRRGRQWLVVVDPERQAGDGLEALRDLAAEYCIIAILLLTQRKPPAIEALRAQALQYGLPVVSVLRKPMSAEQAGTLLRRLTQPAAPSASPTLSRDELNQCLRAGRMHARFEPQIELQSGRPVGCEAHAYIGHPLYGPMPAAGFGQALAQLGAQRMLAATVLRESAALVRALRERALDVPVAVNLSIEVLSEPGDAQALDAYVRTLGIDPEDLALELDAARMSALPAAVRDNLGRLGLRGYTLVLDQPGPLLELDAAARSCFAAVKLRRIDGGGAGFEPYPPCIQGAHGSDIEACALEIRTPADLQQARDAGFATAQGSLFAGALPAAEVLLWVEREARNRSFQPVQRENQVV